MRSPRNIYNKYSSYFFMEGLIIIVLWCNENQGFLLFLSLVSSSLLSVVSVTIALKTARLPFKKRVAIDTLLKYDQNRNYVIDLFVTNVGNMPICLASVNLKGNVKNTYECLSVNAFECSPVIPSQNIYNIQITISNPSFYESKVKHVDVIIYDSSWKKYKSRIFFPVG